MFKPLVVTILALLALLSTPTINSAPDPKECEVCMEVLGLLDDRLGNDKSARSNMGLVEAKIGKLCEEKTLSETRKKVCYYVDPIKRQVSQMMKNGLPNDKICKRLAQKSSEICAVRNKVKVQKGATDYATLKVKDLKKILADRGVQCDGCVEKDDFVKRCMTTEHLERDL